MKQARTAPTGVLTGAHKWLTGFVTLTAALLALLVNARNLGFTPWLGLIDLNYADQVARRVVVTPRSDTLRALGDTAPLGAIVTDANGAALVGARLRWRSLDSSIATVDSGGAVVAGAPGRTEIEVSVREVTGRAVIHVIQQPARVVIAGDSAIRLHDGDSARLVAQVVDGRDRRVLGTILRWQTTDSSIVTVDSAGAARALGPGRAYLWAGSGDLRSRVRVDVELTPASLVLHSGEGQRAVAGHRLSDPVVVQVRSRGGLPVPGAAVTAQIGDEGGTADPASATTDADGRVRIGWTLSPRAGMQRLLLRVAGVDSALAVSAEGDPVPGNVRVEVVNPALGGPAGREMTQPVVLRVTDTNGLALSQVRLGWTAADGGSVTGPARTDSAGGAQGYWTLGRRAGRQRLRVQVGNPRFIPATEVTATADPGVASAIAVLSGESQRATAGSRLSKPVVVTVTDSSGNPVPGATVTAAAEPGAVADSLVTTGGDGRASVRWTLGPKTGDQRLTVRLAGTKAVTTVSATARPGKAARMALSGRPGGTKGALKLTAVVTDAHGNAVSAAPVAFVVSSGTLSAARMRTDSAGRAVVAWMPPVAGKGDVKFTASVVGTKVTAAHTAKAAPSRP